MKTEIFSDVSDTNSDVPVVRVDISHVVHDKTPDDDEEELDEKKKGDMNHLSLPHGHLPLAPLLYEGGAHLHVDPGGPVALQLAYKDCVDKVGFYKYGAEDHSGTEAYENIENKAGDIIEWEDEKKYSTELTEESSSKNEGKIVNS